MTLRGLMGSGQVIAPRIATSPGAKDGSKDLQASNGSAEPSLDVPVDPTSPVTVVNGICQCQGSVATGGLVVCD